MKARAILFSALLASSSASARKAEPPDPRWGDHAELLARVVVVEADGRPHDWAAILWVLEHRRARSASGDPAGAILYSAPIRHGKSKRARRILEAPLERMPAARRLQVERAQRFVAAWIAGRIGDPCPRATHWGGLRDAWPSRYRVLQCGPTLNTFGTERVGRS